MYKKHNDEFYLPSELSLPRLQMLKWECIFCGAKSDLKRFATSTTGTITYCPKCEHYKENMVKNMNRIPI